MELFFRLWIPGFVFLLLGLAKAEEEFPLTEWTTAYSMAGELEIAKDSLLTTLPKLTKQWRVSFEVNPTDYENNESASLRLGYSKTVKPLPAAGEWTKIEVSQVLLGANHVFSISIGDNEVFTKTNSKPVELNRVKVYSGSPWYTNQNGFIRKLKIETEASNCVPAGKSNKTISDEGITVDFWIIKVHTSY